MDIYSPHPEVKNCIEQTVDDPAIEKRAYELAKSIVVGSSSSPKGIASGAIYAAYKEVGASISQTEISSRVGVTETTLRKSFRKIKRRCNLKIQPATKKLPVTPSTKDKIDNLKISGMTYDEFINRAVNHYEEFGSEKAFRRWFNEHYTELGFSKIIEDNIFTTPDYVVEDMEGKRIKVELELKSSNFYHHGHSPDDVDLVICLQEDAELPVQVVEILSFCISSDRRWKQGTLTRQRRIRLDEYTDDTIIKLSKELEQSYSKTARELISIGWTLMFSSDKVTLRDLLIESRDKLIDMSMPLSKEMVEVVEDSKRDKDGQS